MAQDSNVIGLTLVKIDGIFHVDVANAKWSVKRAQSQTITGGGVRTALGVEMPSGSFDEVIPRSKGLNWRALKNFSIEIYDKETKSIVVAAFSRCNWGGIDGSSDTSSAKSGKAITWVGEEVVQI